MTQIKVTCANVEPPKIQTRKLTQQTKKERSGCYLRLDVYLLYRIFTEPTDVDLTVKMPDVTDNGVVFHVLKVSKANNN